MKLPLRESLATQGSPLAVHHVDVRQPQTQPHGDPKCTAVSKVAFRELQYAHAGPFPFQVLLSWGAPLVGTQPCGVPATAVDRIPLWTATATCNISHDTLPGLALAVSFLARHACVPRRCPPVGTRLPVCMHTLPPCNQRQQPASARVPVLVLRHRPIARSAPKQHVNHLQTYTTKPQLPSHQHTHRNCKVRKTFIPDPRKPVPGPPRTSRAAGTP